MSPKHIFTVQGKDHPLSDTTVLQTLAIVQMTIPPGSMGVPAVNSRVLAIKALRSHTGLGLFEAKHIVDFIAEKGRVLTNGEVMLEDTTPPVITYRQSR